MDQRNLSTNNAGQWSPIPERYELIERFLDRDQFATSPSGEPENADTRFAVLARDKTTGQNVQILTVAKQQFDSDGLFRFRRHCEALANVSDPNFLAPIDWGIEADQVYCVQPHDADLRSVKDAVGDFIDLQNHSKHPNDLLSSKKFLEISKSVLETLAHIHQCGTHQDLRLTQFSFRRDQPVIGSPSPLLFIASDRRPNSWSLEYARLASPELTGLIDADVDGASDIYSVGIWLYCLATGGLPFDSDQLSDILFQQLTAEPDLTLLEYYPQPIRLIVTRMLQKEPRDRYQSAEAVIADVDQALQVESGDLKISQFVVGRFDRRDTLADPAFVGRRDELRSLQEAALAASQGSPACAVVQCPSGIGKTRLVIESLRSASKIGFEIYRGQALDNVSQQPAGPVLQIIKQIQSQHALHQRLRQGLARDQDLIAATLPEFASEIGLVPQQPKVASKRGEWSTRIGDSAEFGQNRLIEAFCKILTQLGSQDQPALIWLDDCQWFDPLTLNVCSDYLKQIPPHTFVVLSMRSNEGVSHDVLKAAPTDCLIEPQPLQDFEIQSLIESMAGFLPAEAVQTSIRLAAGSPFMASTIMRGMVETGALQCIDDQWQIDSDKLSSVKASTDAAEALLNRLECVPDPLLKLLSVAAIAGKSFHSSVVTEIGDVAANDAAAYLGEARRQRLIWLRSDGQLAFVHDKIREAIIDRLNGEQRQQFHRRLAEHLVEHFPDRISDTAFHFGASGCFDRAFPFALQAADQAEATFSLNSAAELLKIAIQGAPKNDSQIQYQISQRLAQIFMLDGQYADADHWFCKTAQMEQTEFQSARTESQRGELAFKQGDKREAVKRLESAYRMLGGRVPDGNWQWKLCAAKQLLVQVLHSALPLLFVNRSQQASDHDRLRWRILSRLAHGYWFTHGMTAVLWAHLKSFNGAQRYAPTPELAQAYSEHAPAMSLVPYVSRGAKYAKRSLEIREDQNDLWGQGQTCGFYSILLYAASRFQPCIEQARRGEATLKKTGDPWEVNIARYQLAAALFRQGNLKEALEIAKRTYAEAMKIGDFQATRNIIDVWARASLGEISGEVVNREINRNLLDHQGDCQALMSKGVHLIAQSFFMEAADCFQAAIDLAEQQNVINTYTAPNYAWLATALRREWETNRPATSIQQTKLLARIGAASHRAKWFGRRFQNDLPHALREVGYFQAMKSRPRAARRSFLRSIRIAQRQGANYEAALSRVAYGKIGQGLGWENAHEMLTTGTVDLEAIRGELRNAKRRDSISLADRFDSLLDAGREIASSIDQTAILEKTVEAARQILRGSKTLIVFCERENSDLPHETMNHLAHPVGHELADGQLPQVPIHWSLRGQAGEFDLELVEQAYRLNQTVINEPQSSENQGGFIRLRDRQGDSENGAALCSPIQVGDQIVACLYVSNRLIKGLYGSGEIRIAEFLTRATGAALEKADGFNQLEALNRELEQRVKERTGTIEARSKELEVTASELRQTKRDLERACAEAETANRTKGEFLASMSHEIRTPITAIIGFTDLILRGVITGPDQQFEKLKTIQSNGEHLLDLINDLLDLSKIEAGKIEVENIPCQPAKIIKEAVDTLQSKAVQNFNYLCFEIDGDTPQSINSDPKRLKQIVTNIVGNAIKFTSNGQVKTVLRAVPSTEHQLDSDCTRTPPMMLEIEVADSGIGMNQDQLATVFDPFVQADSTVTRCFGGTGLGLSISLQLAKSLGGGIEVTSYVGQGSTFTIRIDAGNPDELSMLPASEIYRGIHQSSQRAWVSVDLSGLQVLYADDSETNRELVNLMLSDCGATVDLVNDGLQATQALLHRPKKYDVVMMDMQMPVMDGYTAVQKLRSAGFQLPIVALTANSMAGDRERCIDIGCSDYLPKPFEMNQLLTILANLHGVSIETTEARTTHFSPPDNVATGRTTWQQEWMAIDDAIKPFAESFLKKFEDRFELLAGAVAARDFTQVREIAHWAKGTAGTVQLQRLSTLAMKMITEATHQRWCEAEKILDSMASYRTVAIEKI